MNRHFLPKFILIFGFLNFIFSNIFCQEINSYLKNEVYFIGYKEFDTLIIAYPNECNVCGFGGFCIEKSNLIKMNKNYPEDKDYFLLEYDSYMIFTDSPRIYKYILPHVSDSVASIIKKSYPHSWISEFCEFSDFFSIENFRYKETTQKKFLVFLVHVELYNHMGSYWSAHCDLFDNEKTKKGIYVKLLIPIFEDRQNDIKNE